MKSARCFDGAAQSLGAPRAPCFCSPDLKQNPLGELRCCKGPRVEVASLTFQKAEQNSGQKLPSSAVGLGSRGCAGCPPSRSRDLEEGRSGLVESSVSSRQTEAGCSHRARPDGFSVGGR